MENLNKKNVFFFILFLGWLMASGQTTIWSEDFESYTNGTQTGNGTGTSTASWSTNDTDIDVHTSGGSQVLRGQQTGNTTAYWTTNTINVSSFALFSFSLNANSGGSLDAGQDIFRIEYRLDGGSYVQVEEASGVSSDPISSSYSVNSLSANTLEFRITFYNTGGDEFYEIDNILVQEGSGGASNDPPAITATGDQEYCPGTSIPVVESISITDSDDTTIDEVSIQISSGYVNGEDVLTLTGTHPSITASWSVVEGKLTLSGPATLAAFEAAVSGVEFSTSGTNPSGNRSFSITVGDTNFLPETGHYYEFVSDVGIRWTDARDAAALRTYYGLQGYLATLTSQEEADFSGSQAQGVGWIGASDAAVEGDWRWVTGPEAGTPFWSGNASGNTTPPFNFAYWNGGEPNQSGNEDYAHIADPAVIRGTGGPGSWNDLRDQGGGGNYRPQGYVVEYGGTAGDPVINVTAVTTIEIDNENPTASNPSNITVECTSDIPPVDVEDVTDEADNCSAATDIVVAHVSDVSDGNSNPETITRTYSVTDEAGNNITVTQLITVDDVTNPTASNPAPVNVSCTSDIPSVDINDVTDEADNCSATANIMVAFVSDVSDGNSNPETITRTYSVTDEAGNSVNVQQTITVNDTTDPVITGCPSNITTNVDSGTCGAIVTWTLPTVTDNCGGFTLTSNNYNPGDSFLPGVTTVIYTATDGSGNTTTCSFTVTVNDNEAPVITGPGDITVSTDTGSCNAIVNYTLPTVADNCVMGDGTFPITEDFEVPNRNTLINQCYQFIGSTVSTNNPLSGSTSMRTSNLISGSSRTLISPLVYFNGTGQLTFLHRIDRVRNNNRITVSLIDESNTATVVFTEVYSNNSVQSEAIDVSLTGNYRVRIDFDANSNATDRGRIDDLNIPGLKIADTSGSGACPAASFEVVQNIGLTTGGSFPIGTTTNTFEVTDAFGNIGTYSFDVTVSDNEAPTASDPSDITVECIGDVPAADVTVVTDEADNCSAGGDIVVAFVGDSALTGSNPGTITRTYSVTDEAGNSINVTQDIIVDDTQAPTASDPSDIVVECIGDVPTPDPTVVTDEADNCSSGANITVAFVGDSSDGNSNPETITRTYSVTDEAGNSINVTQDIIVDDTQAPTASDPSDITVECIGDVPAPDPTVVTDEADNCSSGANITVAFVGDSSDGNSNPETITRTYSVTDEAGNSINVTQDIIVDDTIDPTASNPSDITVECIGDVPASDITVVTDGADNCSAAGDIVVAFVGDSALTGSNPGTITRTYSVTDEAGNSINVTQDIIVDDTIDPTASNPSDITVECIGDVPAADVTVVTDGADNCSAGASITVAFVGDSALTGSNPGTITRTYSVTDEAGNSINVEQDIIVDDTIDPTASNPSDITVECIGDVPAADVTVVTDGADNCSAGASITVAFVGDSALTGSNPGTITRTYSVTDEAGNGINVTQDIIVDDTTDPTASNPSDITVECIGDVPAADITVVMDGADNCSAGGDIVVAFVGDSALTGSNPGTITRTYSVTDEAGNSINVEQNIIVDDTQAPTASDPSDITVECIGDVPAADITVVTDGADNCSSGANITVAFVGDSSDGNSNPETITRTYSVTDEAGNSINVTQDIIVDDTIDPTASDPSDITVECIGDVPAPDPTVVTDGADNCSAGGDIVVAFVGDSSDGNSNPETITRTYSVTDEAGNGINVEQTITIQGIAPDITIEDASGVEGTSISFPIVLSQAKCDEDLVLTFTFTNDTADDSDYTSTAIQLTILAGETSGVIVVPTSDDTLDELDESFTIMIGNVDSGLVGDISDTATGLILDNDITVIDLDSDDDGILDSFEDLNSDNDNDPATNPTDTDRDGIPDYLDIDSDDDGIPDNIEAQVTDNYIPPSLSDTNGNGVDDAYENDGNPGLIPIDSEGDGIPDYVDLDSDDDAVPDTVEAHDFNQDGIPDVVSVGSDKDNDGLDDGYEGSTVIDADVNDEIDDPTSFLPDTDTNGIPDYRDSDDDGDGIETIDEDLNSDGNYANDDSNGDEIPNYLDPDLGSTEDEEVDVINVITPNGDGIHDVLTIRNLDVYPNNTVKIYNRWGVEVYATKSYNTTGNVFDGTSQGRVTLSKDNKLPVGTYFYIVEYEDLMGNMKELSGYLYINR